MPIINEDFVGITDGDPWTTADWQTMTATENSVIDIPRGRVGGK